MVLCYGPQHINATEKKNLNFFLQILTRVRKAGIPIDNFIYSMPTSIWHSNTCEHGIGGLSNEGLAWRWEIPAKYRNKLSINSLEFIASYITIQLLLLIKPKQEK